MWLWEFSVDATNISIPQINQKKARNKVKYDSSPWFLVEGERIEERLTKREKREKKRTDLGPKSRAERYCVFVRIDRID